MVKKLHKFIILGEITMKVVNADKLIEIIREKDFPKKGELHRIITQLAFEAPIGEIPQLDKPGTQ